MDLLDSDSVAAFGDLGQRGLRLNHAREHAKLNRIGAGNPWEAAADLQGEISQTVSFQSTEGGTLPGAAQLFFIHELMAANMQFLELTEDWIQIPKADRTPMSEAQSAAVRLQIAKQTCEFRDQINFLEIDLDEPMRLEVETFAAKASITAVVIHGGEIPNKFKRKTITLCEDILRRAQSIDPITDPTQLAPWCVIEISRCIQKIEPSRLLEVPQDYEASHIQENWTAWHFALGQIATARTVEEIVKAVNSCLVIASRWTPLRQERIALQSSTSRLVGQAACILVAKDLLADAGLLLRLHLGLNAPEEIEGELAHLWYHEGSVHLLTCNTKSNTYRYLKCTLKRAKLLALVESSASLHSEACHEQSLKLAHKLRPIAEELLKEDVDSPLHLAPIGICAWFPWQQIATKNRTMLSGGRRVSWISPSRPRARSKSRNIDSESQRILIIDMSIQESPEVLATWRRLHPLGEIREFSSEKEIEDPYTMANLASDMESHSHITYFGHASADPLNPQQGGLLLENDCQVDGFQLAAIDLSHEPEILLVACEGGRDGLIAPSSSPGHALSEAGAASVVASLWAILCADGASYLAAIAEKWSDRSLSGAWRELAEKQNRICSPMCLIARD